jgi:hypothetical protein
MAKKRTKAQRREAALKSWADRRARAAKAGTPKKGSGEPETYVLTTQELPVDPGLAGFGQAGFGQTWGSWTSPKVVYAVLEGEDIFVCFGEDGSLRRERVSRAAASKLLRELTVILL